MLNLLNGLFTKIIWLAKQLLHVRMIYLAGINERRPKLHLRMNALPDFLFLKGFWYISFMYEFSMKRREDRTKKMFQILSVCIVTVPLHIFFSILFNFSKLSFWHALKKISDHIGKMSILRSFSKIGGQSWLLVQKNYLIDYVQSIINHFCCKN